MNRDEMVVVVLLIANAFFTAGIVLFDGALSYICAALSVLNISYLISIYFEGA